MAVMELKFLSERTPRSGRLLEEMMKGSQTTVPAAATPTVEPPPASLDGGAGAAPQTGLPPVLQEFFRMLFTRPITGESVGTALAKTKRKLPEDAGNLSDLV